jgi:tetratricopeptide (TPR) repeat protein
MLVICCTRFLLRAALLWLLAVGAGISLRGADTTNTTNPANTNLLAESPARPGTNAAAAVDPDFALRSFLKLQEQLHTTLLAIDQARQESSQEFRTNADVLAQRLESLEQSLARQREEHWQNAQHSSRTMLILAGCVIGLGLIGLVFTAVFQSRGMTRLAEIATTIAQDRPLAPATLPALQSGEHLLLGPGSGSSAQRNLLATVEKLQERIQDLEKTTQAETAESSGPVMDVRLGSGRNGGGHSRPQDHAAALVGKAQVLLSLNQLEEALECYDQALVEAPPLAETHLRRGQALEKLKRYEEALASYDDALALNRNLTQAYLGKGAVFNVQERYSEALACYELALRAETKS